MKNSPRLTRFVQLKDGGSQTIQSSDDVSSSSSSILNWHAPRKKNTTRDRDDHSPDEGISVDEFHVSLGGMEQQTKPKQNSIGRNDTSVPPDRRKIFDDESMTASSPNTVRMTESSPSQQRGLKQSVRQSTLKAENTTKGDAVIFHSDWSTFDSNSTNAVSPPTSVRRMWNATIPGESSPFQRTDNVSPNTWSAPKQLPCSKQDSPGNSALTKSRCISTAKVTGNPSFEPPLSLGRDDSSSKPSSPIKPLNPPRRHSTSQRQTPQRRVVKISASDLGLSSKEAFDPDIVRGALRRLKSDSGGALLGATRVMNPDPATPSRTARRRGRSVTSTANRIGPTPLTSAGVDGGRRGSSQPRQMLRQKGMRLCESLTEVTSRSQEQRRIPVRSASSSGTFCREQGSNGAAPQRPRSLSRGPEQRCISLRNTDQHLERRRDRITKGEERALNRAVHDARLLDASESGITFFGGCNMNESSSSLGSYNRLRKSGSYRASRTHSLPRTGVMALDEKESSTRSRRNIVLSPSLRTYGKDEENVGISMKNVFSSNSFEQPRRRLTRADSGLTLQMIDQVGISDEQLRGLRDLGLTITKV